MLDSVLVVLNDRGHMKTGSPVPPDVSPPSLPLPCPSFLHSKALPIIDRARRARKRAGYSPEGAEVRRLLEMTYGRASLHLRGDIFLGVETFQVCPSRNCDFMSNVL